MLSKKIRSQSDCMSTHNEAFKMSTNFSIRIFQQTKNTKNSLEMPSIITRLNLTE